MFHSNPQRQAPPAGKSGARALAIALLCTACLGAWQALTVRFSYGGNWTALFCTGSFRPPPPELKSENIYSFSGPGYDGQFFHYMAHDPWFRRGFASAVDSPKLRYRRILVPGLAWLFAFGQDAYVHAAYIAVIWISIFLGAYWLARLAASYGRRVWIGLLFALVPGVLISVDRMVVDGALASCCAGFALYSREESKSKLYAVLAAGMLARETGLLLIASYVIYLATRRRFRDAIVFSTAAVPAICWFAFVELQTPPEYYGYFSPAFLAPLFQRIAHPGASQFTGAMRVLVVSLDVLGMLGFLAALTWIVWRLLRPAWTALLAAGTAFVILSLLISDPDVWIDPFGYSRIYTPLLLLAAMDGLAAGSFLPAIAMLAIVPRIALQLGPQVLNVLREFTW